MSDDLFKLTWGKGDQKKNSNPPPPPPNKPPVTSVGGSDPKPTPPPEPEFSFIGATPRPHQLHGYSINQTFFLDVTGKFLKDSSRLQLTLQEMIGICDGVEENLRYSKTTPLSKDGKATFEIPLYITDVFSRKGGIKGPVNYPYKLKLTITHSRQDRPLETIVEFKPDNTETPDLQKGMFDDKGVETYPDKCQTGAVGYIKGTPVLALQTELSRLRYLQKKHCTGFFGDLTEEAIKQFQTDSKKNLRCSEKQKKLITDQVSITYDGAIDGIIGPKTREEFKMWRVYHYLRPYAEMYQEDYDNEAVLGGLKPRGGDSFHEVTKPVCKVQKQLQSVGTAYKDAKTDGWFGPKMKESLIEFQRAATNGEFFAPDNTVVHLEEKLEGHREGVACVHTQAILEKVVSKNLRIPHSAHLKDSVGIGGKNNPEDVSKVKKRLKDLGYPVKDEKQDLGTEGIKAIKFFQAFNMTIPHGLVTVDGRIDKGGKTEKALFGNDAKKYDPPKKGAIKPLAATIEKKKNDAINGTDENAKNIWQGIMDVWNEASPYLPDGTRMESGYRTTEGQRLQLYSKYRTFEDKISAKFGSATWQKYRDMQDTEMTDAELTATDAEMHRQICQAVSSHEVALPGKSMHEKGKAIDSQLSDVTKRVRSLLWYSIENNGKIKNITREDNNCGHFEFD